MIKKQPNKNETRVLLYRRVLTAVRAINSLNVIIIKIQQKRINVLSSAGRRVKMLAMFVQNTFFAVKKKKMYTYSVRMILNLLDNFPSVSRERNYVRIKYLLITMGCAHIGGTESMHSIEFQIVISVLHVNLRTCVGTVILCTCMWWIEGLFKTP